LNYKAWSLQYRPVLALFKIYRMEIPRSNLHFCCAYTHMYSHAIETRVSWFVTSPYFLCSNYSAIAYLIVTIQNLPLPFYSIKSQTCLLRFTTAFCRVYIKILLQGTIMRFIIVIDGSRWITVFEKSSEKKVREDQIEWPRKPSHQSIDSDILHPNDLS